MADDSVTVGLTANDLLAAARDSRDRAQNRAEELQAGMHGLVEQMRRDAAAWAAEREALVKVIEDAGLELPKPEPEARPEPDSDTRAAGH